MTRFIEFLRDEDGQTAIEYGLIASGLTLALMTAFQTVGVEGLKIYQSIDDAMRSSVLVP